MTKNALNVPLIAMVVLWCGFAHSAEPLSLKTSNSFDYGVDVSSYSYQEWLNGTSFMKETGYRAGLSLGGTKVMGDSVFVRAETRFSYGELKYSGSGTITGVPDYLWDTRAILGKDIAFSGYSLSPFIGVGYRTLLNDLRGTSSTGAVGYRRFSEYIYIPIGITHRTMLEGSPARLSTTVEYDYFIGGTQKSYLGDISAAYATAFGTVSNKQKNGYGARVSISYEKDAWSVGPYFNYWKVGDSDYTYRTYSGTTYSFLEPSNKTMELGVAATFQF
jgi:hypothetical protein